MVTGALVMIGATGCRPPGPQTLSLIATQFMPMMAGAQPGSILGPHTNITRQPPAPGFVPQYPPPPTDPKTGKPLPRKKPVSDKICIDYACAGGAVGRPKDRGKVRVDLGKGGAHLAGDKPGKSRKGPRRRTTKSVARALADLKAARKELAEAESFKPYSRSKVAKAEKKVEEAKLDLQAAEHQKREGKRGRPRA